MAQQALAASYNTDATANIDNDITTEKISDDVVEANTDQL